MKGFESGGLYPDLQEEKEPQKIKNLETVNLSEIPPHEGVSPDACDQIAKKFAALEEVEGTHDHLDKRTLEAGIQNIVVREILSQKTFSPVTRQEFEELVADHDKELASQVGEYFDARDWTGVTSAVMAIRNDLEKKDNLEDKQAVFCDYLDASRAVDYILVGKNTDKDELFYTMKLVQVKTKQEDTNRADDYKEHKRLADKIYNEINLGDVFETKSGEILSLLEELGSGLDEGDISIAAVVDSVLNKHLHIQRDDDGKYQKSELAALSEKEKLRAQDDFEKLVLLGRQYFYHDDLAAFTEDFVSGAEQESKITQMTEAILEELSYDDFIKEVPMELKSQTKARKKSKYATEQEYRDLQEVESLDMHLLAMYSLDEDALFQLATQK